MKKVLVLVVGLILFIFLVLVISLYSIDAPRQIKYSNIDNNEVKDTLDKLIYVDNDEIIEYKEGFRGFSLNIISINKEKKVYKFSFDEYGEENVILYQYFSKIDNYVFYIILLPFVILIIVFYIMIICILKKDLKV